MNICMYVIYMLSMYKHTHIYICIHKYILIQIHINTNMYTWYMQIYTSASINHKNLLSQERKSLLVIFWFVSVVQSFTRAQMWDDERGKRWNGSSQTEPKGIVRKIVKMANGLTPARFLYPGRHWPRSHPVCFTRWRGSLCHQGPSRADQEVSFWYLN